MIKSLFGYGGTIKAICKEGGFEIYDDKFSEVKKDEFGNILKPISEFDPQRSELEIPSPGMPPYHSLIKNSRNLISEYDYFLYFSSSPKSIWISGTNGKTTTTQMTEFLLSYLGAKEGGNIGIPLAKMDKNASLWILETSSFSLHYTKFARPNIFALLPISPDHLSWHGDYENYKFDKIKILANMKESDIAIIPEEFKNFPSAAKKICYKDENDLASKFNINLDKINFKTPFLLDALMALVIAKIVTSKTFYDEINLFKIDPNKIEEFKDRFERIWVDDSKATNLDASIQAIKRYKDKQIHLILGGDDKGVSLEPVLKIAKEQNAKIYIIGKKSDILCEQAINLGLSAINCHEISKAVKQIAKSLKNGEVALLSPACASLDQFKSYKERGEIFKNLVKSL